MKHIQKIATMLNGLFKITNRMGKRLVTSELRICTYMKNGCIGILVVIMLVLCCIQKYSYSITASLFVLGICIVAADFLSKSRLHLKRICGFLGLGSKYYFLLVFLTMALINTGDFILNIIINIISSALLWWIYSLIADNKVATVSNQILSTLFGLLVIVKDTVVSVIPDYVLEYEVDNGYTLGKEIDMMWGLAFSPFLAINLIALLLCTLKGYWIEKYNGGKDLEAPEDKDATLEQPTE